MSARIDATRGRRRVWGRLRAFAAATWHADWRLAHDPRTGFVQGLRMRMRCLDPKVLALSEALTAGAEQCDAVFHLQPPLDWEGLDLPKAAGLAWEALRPGGWFLLRSRLPRHHISAVITSQGWLTEQVASVPSGGVDDWWFVLRRPDQGSLRRPALDWRREQSLWTAAAVPLAGERPWGARSRGRARRCHVFGVAIAKGGTRSLAGLFGRYHSAHEAAAVAAIQALAREDRLDWRSWVRERDMRTGELECDSSQLHAWYAGALAEVFPRARFVLTVREPFSWLRSFVDHRLARGLSPEWAPLQRARFGAPRVASPAAGEELLDSYGLPGLDALLGYWRDHHQRVLDAVPVDRLLVLPLSRLHDSLDGIAAFAGVPAASLDAGHGRLNEASARFQVVDRLSRDLLESKIEEIAGPVWRRLMSLCPPAR
jgi:hypothetical protein